jgi:acyl phosphate:glycerol-3-phosphate acyltransferase
MPLAAVDADQRLHSQVPEHYGIHECADYRIRSMPTALIPTALAVTAAYCLGSVSFAIVVSRLLRLPDPRSYGSKNPGATNVLRTGKKAAAVLTLAGDAGKGWLAVWLAQLYTADIGAMALAGLAVFLGHLFPLFHRFHGGKGVATAAGVLLALDWRIGLGTVATWAIIAVFLRYSSLAALVSAVFAPCFTALVLGFGLPAACVTVMAALLVWRHRQNIGRLLAGAETRIGEKKTTPSDPSAAGP